MSNQPDRRRWAASATAIEHAVTLIRTHGTSFASMYLKNQKFSEEAVMRVLTHKSGRRSTDWAEGQFFSATLNDAEHERTLTRQLNYTSRDRLGVRGSGPRKSGGR
jgi:hypothetical protein